MTVVANITVIYKVTSSPNKIFIYICGPGSSAGIAAELQAGRSRIESQLGQDFLPIQTGPGAHPASWG